MTFDIAASGGAVLVVAGILVWLVLEAVLAIQHKPLITQHVRAGIKSYPQAAFVICFFVAFTVGALLGHFFWTVSRGG